MERTAGRILKSNNVKLQGKFCFDASQNVQCSTGERNRTLTSPQVRIVENHPEYAVIEVTCGCGAKTTVKCEYAGN